MDSFTLISYSPISGIALVSKNSGKPLAMLPPYDSLIKPSPEQAELVSSSSNLEFSSFEALQDYIRYRHAQDLAFRLPDLLIKLEIRPEMINSGERLQECLKRHIKEMTSSKKVSAHLPLCIRGLRTIFEDPSVSREN